MSRSGRSEGTETTYRDALHDAHRDALLADGRVLVMGEDVADYGGTYAVTKGLHEEFGRDRVRNTPLSESGFVGVGIGAALSLCQLLLLEPPPTGQTDHAELSRRPRGAPSCSPGRDEKVIFLSPPPGDFLILALRAEPGASFHDVLRLRSLPEATKKLVARKPGLRPPPG